MRDADLNPVDRHNRFPGLRHNPSSAANLPGGASGKSPIPDRFGTGQTGGMGALIGIVALLVTLVAVVAAVGHGAYLGMLTSAAKKRPGGQPVVDFARKRLPVAGATVGVTLLALLISSGDTIGADVFAMLLGAGGGAASLKALQTSQSKFRNNDY